jgi:RimJ/RimL family protein N-acetyltransferase
MKEITLSGYIPGAIGRITELHAVYYHQHWNFGLFFESKVAEGLSEFLNRFDPSRDGFWIAVKDGNIIASIAIDGIHANHDGAKLRWFIVAPQYQGTGIGKTLIRTALDFCKARRYRRVHLSTFAGLDAARNLYERNGFTLYKEFEGDQWGVVVKEQIFELLLPISN